jgi:Tfp pilus assembly protein PilV
MIRTTFIATAGGRLRLDGETGDTLIEVLISAVLIALVVAATAVGLNSTNRATAFDRARSEADALAQQAEDQLRSEPIANLSSLKREQHVEEGSGAGKTKFKIVSESEYIADSTATSSCKSSTPEASYLQTTSTVTWPSIGVAKPVVESSVISPPAGAALIVQVTEASKPLEHARVSASGPTPGATEHALETSSDGCAILALSPGGYELNASKAGYVTPNWYPNTHEDLSTTRSVYLPAETETTTKVAYSLGQAGELRVKFHGPSSTEPEEGDSFVAFNSGMYEPKHVGTVGTYASTVLSGTTVYPYPETSPYSVYAGSCEADSPAKFGIKPEEAVVTPGGTAEVAVTLPPVNIEVMSGSGPGSATEGSPVSGATVYIVDKGCPATRSLTTTASGALSHPGLPFGAYEMCVSKSNKKWEKTFENSTTAGPSPANWTEDGVNGSRAVIYLGTSPSGSPTHVTAGSCP